MLIQQINFTANLDRNENTRIEKEKVNCSGLVTKNCKNIVNML